VSLPHKEEIRNTVRYVWLRRRGAWAARLEIYLQVIDLHDILVAWERRVGGAGLKPITRLPNYRPLGRWLETGAFLCLRSVFQGFDERWPLAQVGEGGVKRRKIWRRGEMWCEDGEEGAASGD